MYRRRICCSTYNTHTVYSHDTLCTLTEVNTFYTLSLSLTHTHTHTHTHRHTLHTHSLLCSLWMGVVFLAVQLFEDERLLGLSTHLWPKTFDNTLTNTRTHAFPLQTFLSISYSILVHVPAQRIRRQTHKWHLTCLNRLAIHSTTFLDVSGFVCTLVSVPKCVCWPISCSKLPVWFGPGNKLVVFYAHYWLLVQLPLVYSHSWLASSLPFFLLVPLLRFFWFNGTGKRRK